MLFIEVLHYIGMVQAAVMGIVLFTIRREGRFKFKFLAFLLLCICLSIINETYDNQSSNEFHLLYPFKFFLLLPNLVYLYVSSKIEPRISSKKLFLNFIAGGLEFLVLCLIMILANNHIIHPEGDFLYYFYEIYNYVTILYAILIQVIILKKIASYNGNLFKFFSTVRYKYLNWLKWVCVIFILKELFYSVFYIFSPDVEADDSYYFIYVLLELVLIFYIGIAALLQVNLKIELHDYSTDRVLAEETIHSATTSKDQETFEKIESFMKSSRPFLQPELNLKSLAQMMQIPERKISNAINQNTDSNFYTYINFWRVAEVKSMLKDATFEKYSIAGIGEAAGFNSKSSFYNNFKKVTGFSPSQYMDKLSKNTF